VRPQDDGDAGHDENPGPPAKKGKPLPAQTRPVPRPVQKKTQVQDEETMDRFDRLRPQDDDDAGHDENPGPPAKKGKPLPAQTRPVPRPVQKKTQVQDEETMDRFNAKKRPSEAADDSDHVNGPKTPVPSKKAKIQPNKSKAVPIRRSGKPFSFLLN
jgi:hypothetical protein